MVDLAREIALFVHQYVQVDEDVPAGVDCLVYECFQRDLFSCQQGDGAPFQSRSLQEHVHFFQGSSP
ncbi:hypothetical protein ASF01_12800 [Stenotrophomonas sp. Leaf70]|uniref:Uncharacterized protein n=1 Tax=Stenotrophomonas nitritireducens TaxID=83617 RepID=A0ABR5NMI5_9GAMM|nr:hypothetical protein ASF01_12800 [Stenotrophomonas sp. Leaf70]KRG59338.1 hypothetical protein ABB22_04340 [Stenotrophomonas nitritireducens]